MKKLLLFLGLTVSIIGVKNPKYWDDRDTAGSFQRARLRANELLTERLLVLDALEERAKPWYRLGTMDQEGYEWDNSRARWINYEMNDHIYRLQEGLIN